MHIDTIARLAMAAASLLVIGSTIGCGAGPDDSTEEAGDENPTEESAQAVYSAPFDCTDLPNDGVGSGLEECEGGGTSGAGSSGGGGGNDYKDWENCVDDCVDHCPDSPAWQRYMCAAACSVACGPLLGNGGAA
jgi:hypothetical protein